MELFLIVYNNFVINEWVCNCCLISYKVLIVGCSCLFDEIFRRIFFINLGNDWRCDKID